MAFHAASMCLPLLLLAPLAGAEEPPVGPDAPKPAETEPAKEKVSKGKDAFELRLGGGLEVVYDDNVFNLDDDKQDKLEDDDEPNNRFDRMDSVDDILLQPFGRLELGWKSLGGKDAELRLQPRWTQYVQNELKSYADFGLKLTHETWKRGEVFVSAGYTPRRYRKNYFETGNDANGNGNISGEERVFDQAIYHEWDVLAGVGSRIAGDLSGELAGGYRMRDYKAPFQNRDEDAIIAKAGLEYELWESLVLGLDYLFEWEMTDGGRENVLIDEDIHGELDGTAGLDSNALIQTRIDRSNLSHELGPSIKIRLTKRLSLRGFYRYRYRDFTSNEDLDLSYNGRTDRRHTAGGELEIELASWMALTAGYTWVRNDAERPNRDDDSDEEVGYTKNVVSVGMLITF
jgi:hypothetical protein